MFSGHYPKQGIHSLFFLLLRYNKAVMNPTNPQQLDDDVLQNVHNPLKVMQPGERVVCEIKRHPFGLLSIYFVLAVIIVLAAVVVALAPQFIPGITSQSRAVMALIEIVICAIATLFTYVSVYVYKGNRWVITTDSITQITQTGLFGQQIRQLSLANLEDVSVEQNGLLQTMFGFGRLRAESAGERAKFVFDFCPRPQEFARQIIAAHEAYIAEKPAEMYTTNRPLANTSSFNQSYGSQQQYDPTQPTQPQAPVTAQAYDPTKQNSA